MLIKSLNSPQLSSDDLMVPEKETAHSMIMLLSGSIPMLRNSMVF